jgi:hypothetical protein
MARRRWEIAHEKAAEGMVEAVEAIVGKLCDGEPVDSSKIKTEAWKHVMKRATEVYMKSDSIRGMSEMGNFIGKHTGMTHDGSKDDKESSESPFMGLETAKVIMQVYNFYQGDYRDVIDEVDIIDAEVDGLLG